jgi:hypothetical protein
MNPSLFWFSDEQWAKIEPHLPANQLGLWWRRPGRMRRAPGPRRKWQPWWTNFAG